MNLHSSYGDTVCFLSCAESFYYCNNIMTLAFHKLLMEDFIFPRTNTNTNHFKNTTSSDIQIVNFVVSIVRGCDDFNRMAISRFTTFLSLTIFYIHTHNHK